MTRRLPLVAAVAVVAGCHHDGVAPTPPAALAATGAAALEATVNTVIAPAFLVTDAAGNPLGDVPVTVAVRDGGGTLTGAPARTAHGPTLVGQWKLGTHAGRNALTITVASLPTLILEATGRADHPTALAAGVGDGQVGFAGARLASDVGARVVDQFGNPVAGVSVVYAVTKGDGSAAPLAAVSGNDGIAGPIAWTLGKAAGTHELTASVQALTARITATARSDFAIDLRFFGPAPSPTVEAAFRDAAERVRGAITGDISDVALANFDVNRCGVAPNETLNELVDDVIIYATVTIIDGPGNILGSAGPCVVRTTSRFAVIGIMRFDVDDMNALVSGNRLGAVVLHEMLHVVGVGTIWRSRNLLLDPGSADPRYTGALGIAKCIESGGTDVCGLSVPVENVGAAGSVDSHWRESVFDTELMTSRAEAPGVGMPLSAITIGSLQDYGYEVNLFAADPFTVPPVIAGRLRGVPPGRPWDTVLLPQFEVDRAGRVAPLRYR